MTDFIKYQGLKIEHWMGIPKDTFESGLVRVVFMATSGRIINVRGGLLMQASKLISIVFK